MANGLTETEIKDLLSGYKPVLEPKKSGFKAASILVPFYPHPDGLSIVFMKRPDSTGPHGGQISFPGGGRDKSDQDDLSVALRETEEEIGVQRDLIEVWGGLKTEFTMVSRYWVTPFVGKIPYPGTFCPSKDEVDRLLVIPFEHLMNPNYFSLEKYNWKGLEFPSYLYKYKDDVIWGLTARVLYNLISLLTTGEESDTRWPPA
jgi:8-oxo-dGTP pyrophosphatase MutT (NUDIX family)